MSFKFAKSNRTAINKLFKNHFDNTIIKEFSKSTNLKKTLNEYLRLCVSAIIVAREDYGASHEDLRVLVGKINNFSNRLSSDRYQILEDYKLAHNWFRYFFAQVSRKGGDNEGIDNFMSVLSNFYKKMGWELDDELDPQYDQLTTIEELDYFDEDDRNTLWQCPMIPATPYPIGSIWKNAYGKEWECNGKDENGKYILIEEQPSMPNGRYVEILIDECKFSEMQRIK